MRIPRHRRQRHGSGGRPFVALMLGATVWTVAQGSALAQRDAGATPEWRTLRLPLPPAGADIVPERPRPAALPGCVRASRAPVCVHIERETQAAGAREVARWFDRVSAVAHGELRMPEPAPDGNRGGGPELDVYLHAGDWPFEIHADPPEGFALWDRAPCFITLRDDLRGVALERAVAESYLHAVMLGTDARVSPSWRYAWAASVGAHTRALPGDDDARAWFQRSPARALLAERDRTSARGAALFFDFLAAEHDTPDARLMRGLLWMPVGRTLPDAARWSAVPDGLDVLERMFRGEEGGLDAALTEFTIHRALAGTDGDRLSLVSGEHTTQLAIEPIARVDMARLPHWVTPARGLEETGSAVVLVDTHSARDASLNIWFHGVPWRQWALAVVRLDARMRVVGRVPRPIVERGGWSSVLEALDGVEHVLVVITALGNHDYHPDLPTPGLDFFAVNFARS